MNPDQATKQIMVLHTPIVLFLMFHITANPSTGVSVYNGTNGGIMGGTSAGAPQWAAIHALGLSATNTNLYQRAKSAYSSYFRDITSWVKRML